LLFALAAVVACGNSSKNGQTASNPDSTTDAGAPDQAGRDGGGFDSGGSNSSGSSGSNSGGSSGSNSGGGGLASGGTESAGKGGANAGAAAVDSGDAGAGGEPFVAPPRQVEFLRDKVPEKLDLLMMIDNSISMGSKQHLLADAVQHLVDRLVQPRCLDEAGSPTGTLASGVGWCPAGSHPEFVPFADIHAAVITSSLGSHGAQDSNDVCQAADDDDHAQLLGVIRPGLPSWNGAGFLAWDPSQRLTPPGIGNAAGLASDLAKTVSAAGDQGCGYEAPLEAWYRFLVDPEPPAGVTLQNSRGVITGISAQVLAQRQAFLRPDSVLSIVMLSDENDCSIVDEGYGWLISHTAPMFRSTSACAANPNDPCCQSCGETTAHAGCPALANDSACKLGTTLAREDDDLNLRCYHQKQRFGFDLLYPVQRYIDGLTSPQVKRRSDGAMVPNPIYQAAPGAAPRSAEQVLLLGIVGVPWQDVADAASLSGPGLKLLGENGPLSADRWDIILGNPSALVAPLDPFMIETVDDRTTLPVPQSHPILENEKLVPSSSTNPVANHINGHETNNADRSDLQQACIFELPNPVVCDTARSQSGEACDCFAETLQSNRPLCQPAGGGAATTTQRFGQVYPGIRELEVLRGIGNHGIVASACPKTADLNSPSYGYRPAMDALVGRLPKQVGRSCVQHDAKADANGRTACRVITAQTAASCSCPADQGLGAPVAEAVAPVREALAWAGYCAAGAPCEAVCLCELQQLQGADLAACQTADAAPAVPGFCYLDAVPGETQAGAATLARDCVGSAPRRIRFSGTAPAANSVSLLYCAD